MRRIREEMKRPVNRKNILDLYTGYMKQAFEARLKRDRVLFDACYQRAEYYLRLMNRLGDSPFPGFPAGGTALPRNPKKG